MSPTRKPERSPWFIVGVVVSVAVLLAALALALAGDGEQPVANLPPPTVEDTALPPFTGQGDAVGQAAPTAIGPALLEEGQITIPAEGEPTIIIFLAHWCPHCQREVPIVQEWLDGGGLPEGVAIRAVATGNDPARPNYPPDAWLEGEGWQVPTMLDDTSVAEAYGLTEYPFWVFVNAEGEVVGREGGVLERSQLEQIAAELAD